MTFDKFLIVDDELSIHRLLEHHLNRQQYKVSAVDSLQKAEEILKKERFDLILLDYCLPDGEAGEFLKRMARDPSMPLIVVMSGHNSVESAISCIRNGAFDYLPKPFSLEELDFVISRAEASRQAVQVNRYRERELSCAGTVLGESPGIVALRGLIERVAPTETTVLVTGESGVGKEHVAEILHRASTRNCGPLIKLNCAAGSEGQIDKELFGEEEGTGALELARGGTLVLEEISELPLRAQVKMLRVLQDHQFERPGASKPMTVDARLIATAQRDLGECVARGTFRQDLFFRLNVFPLALPPLRERPSDIRLLVSHWLEEFGKRNGLKLAELPEEALRHLTAYPWPGNLRELENVLERAVILAGFSQPIAPDAFKFLETQPEAGRRSGSLAQGGKTDDPLLTLDELEKRHVLRALEVTNQNRTRAAGLLKISVRTLRNKLHQYRSEAASGADCRQSNLPMISPSAAKRVETADGLPKG